MKLFETAEETKHYMITKYGDEYGLLIFNELLHQRYEEAAKLRDEYLETQNEKSN